MPKRPDHLRLVDLVEAAEGIVTRLAGISVEQFMDNEDLQEIALWRLVKLGEAASRVSQEMKDRYPAIDWRHAVALRNRLAHGYFDVDLEIVYTTAVERLPKLASDVRSVLESEFPGELAD
ncbi:MAG TPA: HepT-like ribonuclease domain-containing protein [Pseudonocardiaceae bacterium]|nr:HepT-like ribonuclease domain-containing protein [Pseudonocardiaceae bacterium]